MARFGWGQPGRDSKANAWVEWALSRAGCPRDGGLAALALAFALSHSSLAVCMGRRQRVGEGHVQGGDRLQLPATR
jgi:hypothetical protein